MRKVYIDVGSNIGSTIRNWQACLDKDEQFEIHAFECNPMFWPDLNMQGVTLHKEAAWVEDCIRPFYLDETPKSEGSSFEGTKTSGKMSPKPLDVQCVDFSTWLKKNFSPEDEIVVKFNIEGAEYPILERMMADGTIHWVNKLFIWWHFIPYHFEHLTEEQAQTHSRVFKAISALDIIAPCAEGVLLLFGKDGVPK